MPFPHHSLASALAVAVLFCAASVGWSEDGDATQALEVFEKQVRPALVEHCIRCHGPKKQQGGLRLDSAAGWSEGGDSGAAIHPREADSILLNALRYEDSALEMPPRGKLPEQTIAAFERWVALGAVDPREPDSPNGLETEMSSAERIEQGRQFWAFQPIRSPAIPKVADSDWARNEIDHFVLSGLESADLSPSADADRRTLIRRLYFDLLGLPPTPDQIEAHLSDDSPDAYQRLVDRLLASPLFGQRWGRHWLDVVRFAESSGGGRTLLFPDAWRYRDFVVDSLNEDVSYDRFLQQQVAGDLLPSQTPPIRKRNLTATAFWLLGPTNYEMQNKDQLEMDVIDEQLDTMGKAFLGMTIGCARCHDHKFDPIPASDYYALAGILKSTKSLTHSNVSVWNKVELPLSPQQAAIDEKHQAAIAQAQSSLQAAKARWVEAGGMPSQKDASIDPQLLGGIVMDDGVAQKIGDWIESSSNPRYVGDHYLHDETKGKGQKQVVFQTKLPAPGEYEVRISYSAGSNRSQRVPVHVHHRDGTQVTKINQKRKPSIARAFVSLGHFHFDHDVKVVVSNEGTDDGVVIADAVMLLPRHADANPEPVRTPDPKLSEQKAEIDRLQKELNALKQATPDRPVVMATQDGTEASDIHLAVRGELSLQGPLTPRGALQIASWEPFPDNLGDRSGRLELAQWIIDARNPLTARVMANRVWYWLIGRGLVSTVDNFGSMGQKPTHPELLDHLASEFQQSGWSTKNLVRRILLSRTYRMSSQSVREYTERDPDNRLIWRMNRKRFRAEDMRDSLLSIAGSLDLQHGGSNIKAGTKIEYGYQFDSLRRSIYVPVFRNTLPQIFEVFDFADPNTQRGQRSSSTVASQALMLMNHPWVNQQAHSAAKKLLSLPQRSQKQRIEQVFAVVLGRKPSPEEHSIAVDLVESTEDNGEASEMVRWAMLYQVLFQSLDFRYLN
ncbi:MAG: DUF1553 domain-containing protein [Rubripirellula sp.]